MSKILLNLHDHFLQIQDDTDCHRLKGIFLGEEKKKEACFRRTKTDAGNSVALRKMRITEEIQEIVWITADLGRTGVHVQYG